MGWRIVLIVISLLMVSVLELGKHTLWGWVIAAALILCFWILKAKHTLPSGGWKGLGMWCALLAVTCAGKSPSRWTPGRAC